MKKIFITIFILVLLPTLAYGQSAPKLDYSGFVKCDGVVKDGEEYRKNKCDFAYLIETVNLAINWMFVISIPIAATIFAYGGLLYMTGKDGNIKKAREIFANVAIGFIIMATAWFVVRTVVDWFVDPKSGANFFLKSDK